MVKNVQKPRKNHHREKFTIVEVCLGSLYLICSLVSACEYSNQLLWKSWKPVLEVLKTSFGILREEGKYNWNSSNTTKQYGTAFQGKVPFFLQIALDPLKFVWFRIVSVQ